MTAVVDRGAFGPVLRRLRLEAGISQEELAERARLSVESISALERGRRRAPYRETLAMLGDGLQLSDAQRRELELAAQRPRPATASAIAYDSADSDRAGTGAAHEIDPTRQQNLPLARTSLVGRQAEITSIARMVETSRLVTLTGTGGIGKTRTAVAVGDALLESTKAGVWFVELAAVATGSSVAAAVARSLGVREVANRPLTETLLAHVDQKALLLILDNCEHVIAEAAELADVFLRGCPNLRILATSRESLRISGERVYRLPSLRVPPRQAALELTAGRAEEYPAVMMFAQRAQASDHAFTLTDENAPIVAEI